MTIDSIHAATTAAPAANRTSNRSAAEPSTPSGASSGHDSIEDTIHMSAQARERLAIQAYTPPNGDVLVDGTKALKEYSQFAYDYNPFEESLRYGKELAKSREANLKQHQAILNKLISSSGGLLYGTSFSTDLSKPITTTSGSPHPKADIIRAFLQDHKAELDQLNALRQETFPSFEEWKKQQG